MLLISFDTNRLNYKELSNLTTYLPSYIFTYSITFLTDYIPKNLLECIPTYLPVLLPLTTFSFTSYTYTELVGHPLKSPLHIIDLKLYKKEPAVVLLADETFSLLLPPHKLTEKNIHDEDNPEGKNFIQGVPGIQFPSMPSCESKEILLS